MTSQDNLKRTILKLSAFMTKKGQDLGLRKDIIDGINQFTGENSLDTIYINPIDSTLIPDVFVMPKYNKDFSLYIMNADMAYHCPWGYTLEIAARAFDKFQPEELMALIIHAISQNVMSSIAKMRFLNAYSAALDDFRDTTILDVFEDLSHSEVCYIAYADICMRPIRVNVENGDYVGTDEVLKTCGLADAFDQACLKIDGLNNNTPEQIINREVSQDHKTLQVVFDAVVNNDIRHYFEMIKNACPVITLTNISGAKKNNTVLGLVSDPHAPRVKLESTIERHPHLIMESLTNPKNEEELRFQMDKVGVAIDYIATEDEKTSILYRIKVLKLRIMKTRLEVEKKLKRKQLTLEEANYKLAYLKEFEEILETYRKRTIEKKIKPRTVGLWAVYPAGYDF